MIDAKTGLIHTVAGDGEPGDRAERRRRRSGDERAPEHAERRRDRAATATSTSPTCITTASGKVDAKTHIITTVAGNGALGHSAATTVRRRRRRWPDRRASRWCPSRAASVTIFIADYYNGTCAPSVPTASSAT